LFDAADSVTTVGVKRRDYGTDGSAIRIRVNAFVASIPQSKIYHYDVVIDPSKLPARFNMELVKLLQASQPTIFTPLVVYDGRANIFAPRRLPLGDTNSREFHVSLPQANGGHNPTKPPKVYKIKLTLVADINPEVLDRFVNGQQSNDNIVLTAIMALNNVIRQEPNLNNPFNVRSFFTEREKRDIGGGIELWRGYFQSVRPSIGRLLVNVDIATGMMYKEGPLLNLCMDFLRDRGLQSNSPNALSPPGFPDSERIRLQRFISGMRVIVETTGDRKRVIRGLSKAGANQLSFTLRDGTVMTVAQYFQQQLGRPLRFPGAVCVEVGASALIPLEVCKVPKGQIIRKQIPPTKTKDLVEFSTKRPDERLRSIMEGVDMLQYGQSQYIRDFGMTITTNTGPLEVSARVLKPPSLKYGVGSKQVVVTPKGGAWNMVDKRFYAPAAIKAWVILIYETERRFSSRDCQDMIKGFLSACDDVGIKVEVRDPIVKYENGQGNILTHFGNIGKQCVAKAKCPPTLIVAVLPDNVGDLYSAIKHHGDIRFGVATQCLKSHKCSRAKEQYWKNVTLKVNVKLGGINVVPSSTELSDPANPTIVIGADTAHPAPGTQDRPSFTSVVANVDTNVAKYVASTRVQKSRQEIITDLKEMCKDVLKLYEDYQTKVEKKAGKPKRLIFFRDGVSEGQFGHVLSQELPLIQEACRELKMSPKITLIVVGKRHHIRYSYLLPSRIHLNIFFGSLFPEEQADRSGNCPAGTVADRGIAHPTEFDFYLQSHGGLLGTSRPAHYSVLHDENDFNSNTLQAFSFALCHVYARATRSVSIPAPVYYADLVCGRAKNHYDPEGTLDFSESATQTVDSGQADATLEAFKTGFKQVHQYHRMRMYFS
jgi:eukaryotic translation initiation factor 2C